MVFYRIATTASANNAKIFIIRIILGLRYIAEPMLEIEKKKYTFALLADHRLTPLIRGKPLGGFPPNIQLLVLNSGCSGELPGGTHDAERRNLSER